MNFQHLKYFQTVAKAEHITKAANMLHIAQPALSKTIRTLEQELNVSLFSRDGRNIVLNDNGKTLLKYAEIIDREIELMYNEIQYNDQKNSKSITILLKSTPLIVIQLITMFRKEHPDTAIKLITYNRNTHMNDIHYDLWIDSSTIPSYIDTSLTLLVEPLCLASEKDSIYSAHEINLSEVAHENFISLPIFYSQGQEFIEVCKQAGFTPNIVLQSSDYNTIQEMIATRIGVAVVPKYSWGFQRMSSISMSTITHPTVSNYITLNWKNESALSHIARCFIKFTSRLLDENTLVT